MPLWGNENSANTSIPAKPKFVTNANNQAWKHESFYMANASVTEAESRGTHAGIVAFRPGKGHVVSTAVANGGTGYSNGDFVTYTGQDFNPANATFYNTTFVTPDYVTTDGNGAIVSVTTGLISAFYANATATANVTTGPLNNVACSDSGASALAAGSYALALSNTAGLGANVTVQVLANGAVDASSLTINSRGHGFTAGTVVTLPGSNAVFTANASIGSGVVLTPTVGGHVGRQFYENLVAFNSVVEDGGAGSGVTLP